jgi:hypothetical protein
MNGKKAKVLRKKIYGDDFSFRYRKYFRVTKSGQCIADEKRRAYQQEKMIFYSS